MLSRIPTSAPPGPSLFRMPIYLYPDPNTDNYDLRNAIYRDHDVAEQASFGASTRLVRCDLVCDHRQGLPHGLKVVGYYTTGERMKYWRPKGVLGWNLGTAARSRLTE
jgi:hypothetical protein